VNFNGRKVYTGVLKDKLAEGKKSASAKRCLLLQLKLWRASWITSILLPKTGSRLPDSEERFPRPLAYPARPLTGYWATPPYMHNGAIPNLYE